MGVVGVDLECKSFDHWRLMRERWESCEFVVLSTSEERCKGCKTYGVPSSSLGSG